MCSYTTFKIKVDLCAHTDSKNGNLPAEYIWGTFFDSYPLPLLRRLTVGAAIEKNFFIFFRLSFYARLITIWDLLHIVENYGFDIISRFRISDSKFRLVFLFSQLVFPRINFDLFQHCRFYALTLQLFISLTLLLVINKHLCLCEFVLCLFWLF